MRIRLKPAHLKEENLKSLLEKRHSQRNFQQTSLNLDDLATLVWATCGKKFDALTSATRTIPSAGATNPLELFIVVGKNSVEGLEEGVYHYLIEEHSLELVVEGDRRLRLSRACLGQDFIEKAPVSLIISADFRRTTNRYGARGRQYVYMEAGHACQNTYLVATSLGLGTVEVGAFVNEEVKSALDLDENYCPLSVMPVGYTK